MSWFKRYLRHTDHRAVHKWMHYFEVYEREFLRFQQRPIRFLEIGIFKGGSIPMWKAFFPAGSLLVFIDINPECRKFEEEGTHVEIGDQSDPDFLAMLIEKYGPFDLVLDDGSHHCAHQIASFEALWPAMADNSLYVVEDCHTSYWPGFGGGYNEEASFISFAKRKIDAMHSIYTDQDALFPIDPLHKELLSVRFYDSITIFEKRLKTQLPLAIRSLNGKTYGSHASLRMRRRTSIFPK